MPPFSLILTRLIALPHGISSIQIKEMRDALICQQKAIEDEEHEEWVLPDSDSKVGRGAIDAAEAAAVNRAYHDNCPTNAHKSRIERFFIDMS